MPAIQSAPGKSGRSGLASKNGQQCSPRQLAAAWPKRAGDRSQRAVSPRGVTFDSRVAENKEDFIPQVHGPSPLQQFFSAFSLERAFTLFGFVVAAVALSMFGLDLVWGWPFRRAAVLFDATSTVCGFALAYLSWDVFWEQVRGKTR